MDSFRVEVREVGASGRSWLHPVRWLRARLALHAARRAADAELLHRLRPPDRLAWRAEELAAPENRLDVADALRSLVREAKRRQLPGASLLNRRAALPQSERLLALAGRLSDLGQPVAARGILLVTRLLADASSPLYDREAADDLPVALDAALAALEPA